jgi:predicted small lipoprotein YifL
MKTIALLSILFLLASCGIGDKKGPLNFNANDFQPVRADDANFEVLQKRVLPKCIGCHKDWTTEEIVNRFTRENDPENSRLFTTIKEAKMPKNAPPLNSVLLEITRDYIANIHYTRPVEEPLPDDGKPVSFDVVNEKVFKVSCLPCHAQRGLKDAASLANSKWIDKVNPENSKLLTAVVSGKMPKQRNLLTPNQTELIRRYLRNFKTR